MSDLLATEASKAIELAQTEVPASGSSLTPASQIEEDREFLRAEMSIKLEERARIIEMREGWSVWILRAIWFLILFNAAFLVCAGRGWLKFDSAFIVEIALGQTVVQVIGLALIVVGFLFNKDSLMK